MNTEKTAIAARKFIAQPGDSAASLLANLREIAPRLGSVRIDALPGSTPVAFLDKMPRRLTVQMHGEAKDPPAQIRTFLGLTEDQGEQVFDILCRLAAINPAGSWLLGETLASSMDFLVEGSFSGGAASPAMNTTVRELARDMPRIARFEVDEVSQGTQGGFSRRRVFLRAIDGDGHEVAALDTALFTPTIRVLAGLRDGASRVNLERAKVWAQQLDVPLADLALVLQDLSLLTVLIPSPGIVLRT